MGRREVVATKAVTQMVSHLLKLAWYLEVSTDSPAASQMVAAAVAAEGGTVLGALALEQVSDAWFRGASRWMILGVGGYYLFKGCRLWWG